MCISNIINVIMCNENDIINDNNNNIINII